MLYCCFFCLYIVYFKQKTAYEMRISGWSSDGCSSDLHRAATEAALAQQPDWLISDTDPLMTQAWAIMLLGRRLPEIDHWGAVADLYLVPAMDLPRSEEHTSELQSLMRISYAVFCLKKKNKKTPTQ